LVTKMDSIGNFLSQIKNASMARKRRVETFWSKEREALADLMAKAGFLKKVKTATEDKKKRLILELGYNQKGRPALKEIKRVSRPGRRIYFLARKIPWPLSTKGVVIVSTSRGLMTGREARKKNLGGEVICQIS